MPNSTRIFIAAGIIVLLFAGLNDALAFNSRLVKILKKSILVTRGQSNPVSSPFGLKPSASPAITVGTVTGSISACAGTPSASPYLQQFTLSGTELTQDILIVAPAGFEISVNNSNSFTPGLGIHRTAGNVAPVIVYVRSSATAPAGYLSGAVNINAGATAQNVFVNGIIRALPTVNVVPNQTVNNGTATVAVNFSGAANTFNWVNDLPAIGLAASGTGDIASFTAVNAGSSPVTAHVTVTPTALSYLYEANYNDNTLSVIDLNTNKIVATINGFSEPIGVAVSPDGSRVYVANNANGTVSVVNAANNTIIATVKVGSSTNSIVLSPDGSIAYVTNGTANSVSVINTSTNTVTASITVGAGPLGIAISPDGGRLYVANDQAASLSVINTSNNKVMATLAIGSGPFNVSVGPDGSRVYVANSTSGTVSVISAPDNTVLANVPVGINPYDVAVSPDGGLLYVSNYGSSSVSILNTTNYTLTGTIPVGTGPYGEAFSQDGKFLYVINARSAYISVIDVATNSQVTTIPTGGGAYSLGTLVSKSTGCTGDPIVFNIQVNPTTVSPTIVADAATGAIVACDGAPSVSPQVQQFTVSGSSLAANIVATAPAAFELSLNAGTGYGSSVSLPQSAGVVNNTVVYVRSSSSAPAGNISGNVLLSAAGAANQQIAVAGFVNPLPIVNTIANQSLLTATKTTAINFTGIGDIFNWTNDTPGIGLPVGGTGDIAPFIAVNTGVNPVVATITVTPVFDGFAYISNFNNNNVSVVRTSTNKIIATIPVGTGPAAVSVSPDGTRAYVACEIADNVTVINTTNNTIVTTIPVGNYPTGVRVSPDGTRVYVANGVSNTVSVINTATNAVIATTTVGGHPVGVSLSPDGSKVYITNVTSQTVSVISATTNAVIATFNVSSAYEILPGLDGSKLYVSNQNNGTITVLNGVNYSVIGTIRVGLRPSVMALSPDGGLLYVTNLGSNSVSIVNTSTNLEETSVLVGSEPSGVALTQNGAFLYVTCVQASSAYIINAQTRKVVSTVNVGVGSDDFGNFVTQGSGCIGVPAQFTITVNPHTTGTITATAGTGTINACSGNASVSPQIEQFTVSGILLTGDIIATAPTGFEISLSPGSGYSNTIDLPQTGGVVGRTQVYVRSSVTASPGNITGNVVLTSTGVTTQNVAVSGIINASPVVNAAPNQTVVNGGTVKATPFTGTANTYTWTNDTPGIGLAASGSGDISSFTAINTTNSPVTATITATPSIAGFAYITNYLDNTVSIINTTTNTVISTIPVGLQPFGCAVSPQGDRVYITNFTSNTVSVIDPLSNTVKNTINVGVNPFAEVVSPDGSRLYVTNQGANTVSVINTITNTVAATIPVGKTPYGIAISPDGARVYEVDDLSNSVSVINTASNLVIATIPVGVSPTGIAITPDGSKIYVSNFGSTAESVISTATNTVINNITLGQGCSQVIISPDGSHAYVSDSPNSSTYVIDVVTDAVLGNLPQGNDTGGLSFSPDGGYLYITKWPENVVEVLNLTTNKVVADIKVGKEPTSWGNFIKGGGCTGAPVTFTITVNPTPGIKPDIVTGSITACAGSASSKTEQFIVNAFGLTTDVTATAPQGFELSLAPGSGYGSSLTIAQTAGAINGVVVYVRSAATDPPGTVSGNIQLSSPGATSVNVAINGIITAPASVNPITSQSVNNGALTTAVTISGSASMFNWSNDTPTIGLAATGTGNIAPFTGVNTGSSPVVATVTVTPEPVNPIAYAYIANYNDGTVSVINTSANNVSSTISVGNKPFGVSLSPDDAWVYVSNEADGTVSVIKTTTNTVTTTVSVGSSPTVLAVNPNGLLLYVINSGSNTISVVNTVTYAVIASVPLTGTNSQGIAFSPDGARLYVTNGGSNNVSVIDALTNKQVATIGVGGFPVGITTSPDGSRIYVTNTIDGTVSVIDASSNSVIAAVSSGSGSHAVCVSPDGSRLYVADSGADEITVINTATSVAVGTYQAGTNPQGMSLSIDGNLLYIADQNTNSVRVISSLTGVLVANVTVGGAPISLGNFVTGSTGCPGEQITFTITVKPSPVRMPVITADAMVGTISACEGTVSVSPNIEQFAVSGYNLTAGIVATAPAGCEVSLSAGSGYANSVILGPSGGVVNDRLVYVRSAVTALAGNISDEVVLSSAGADTRNMAVTGNINALPVINAVSNQTFSNANLTTGVSFSGNATVFNWVNDNPGIGLAASGAGNIAPFMAVNTSSAKAVANITVTPTSAGTGCIGKPTTFTITINPLQASATGITAGPVAGNIFACAGTASVSPNIQQFTISGSGLTADITAAAPTGFEVSLSATASYSNSVDIAQSAGVVNNVVVYVRSAATAETGDISGNVTISSTGFADQQVGVSGVIDDVPMVDPVPDQTYTNADQTSPVVFTGTSSSYSWTNDTPAIGLAASGTGNITSFKALNTTKTPLIATITVTPQPVDGYAYVASQSSNTVSVINTTTGATIKTIAVGLAPYGVAVSPDNRRVYVTNRGSNTVSVINTVKNVVIATVPVSLKPAGIIVSPDGNKVYVANNGSATVSVIDAASDIVEAKIAVGSSPYGLAVSHNGRIVSMVNGSDVTFIDPASNGVSSTEGSGVDGLGSTFSPNDKLVYITDAGGNKVWAFDAAGNGVESTVAVGDNPAGICVNQDGSVVYSANVNSNSVTVINAEKPTRLMGLANIPVGTAPNSICFSRDGKFIYVVNGGSDNVSVIDPSVNKVIATFSAGANPVAFGNFITGPIGCSGQPVTFTITINPSPVIPPPPAIIIPNTFTPNGDGINDTWDIKNMTPCRDCSVNVYDRYGGKVFSSVGYPKPWDGTFNGSKLPVGTYYYVINIQGNLKVLSGFVAIIR